jgi:hypothetical protein
MEGAAAHVSRKDRQKAIFMELHGMLGTLETNILQIEARYRHSAFPQGSLITVRRHCCVRRPTLDSIWALTESNFRCSSAEKVHARLAHFVATHYAPRHGLKVLRRWLSSESIQQHNVQSCVEYMESLLRNGVCGVPEQKISPIEI